MSINYHGSCIVCLYGFDAVTLMLMLVFWINAKDRAVYRIFGVYDKDNVSLLCNVLFAQCFCSC